MMSRHPQHDCVWCSLLFEIIPFSGDSSILAGLVLFVHHQQHTPLSILLLRVNHLPSKSELVHARSELMRHVHWQWRLRTGEEWRFLTIEDAEDIAAVSPQRTCFAELSAERSRWLATLRKRKHWSQCTKEAKKARRETDKVQNRKAHCGVFTSQV